MRPKYITSDACASLLDDFDKAKKYYQQNNQEWFLERLGDNGLRESSFEFPDPKLITDFRALTTRDYTENDCENIKRLHSAMVDLPLAVASDYRFWVGLSHTYFWDYVQYRRYKEIASGGDSEIKGSYFFMRGVKRSAHVHCVSRLWWAGHMVFDSDNIENPYQHVETLASSAFASNLLLLSSSNLTASHDIVLGILDAIKEQREAGFEVHRKHFVGATKLLNQMGSVTVLDCLNREDIQTIVSEYYKTNDFENLRV